MIFVFLTRKGEDLLTAVLCLAEFALDILLSLENIALSTQKLMVLFSLQLNRKTALVLNSLNKIINSPNSGHCTCMETEFYHEVLHVILSMNQAYAFKIKINNEIQY